MNGKKAKDINLIADNLLKDWIIRNTGNADNFNPNDVERYLPKDSHYIDDTGRKINFYTKRWTVKKLKKLLKQNGSLPENLTIEQML